MNDLIQPRFLSAEQASFAERPPATTFDFLEYHAETTPKKTALILHKDAISFCQFHAEAMRFSRALAAPLR